MKVIFSVVKRLPAISLAVCIMAIGGWLQSCGDVRSGSSLFGNSSPRIVMTSVDDLYRFLTYDEERYPLVSAHRGGPAAGYPENALETFEYNAGFQPLIIECDIRMTKDSVLVLMHDETLDRTTTGQGKLVDYTYEELQAFFLKDPEGELTSFTIPTLEQALAWGKGKVIFTLDVKRGVPYSKVVETIQKQRAEAISVVITYNADQALEVHRLDPNLMISASMGNPNALLQINDRNIPDNRLVAFVGTSERDEAMYQSLHGHGIMCILGTMGNLDRQAERVGDAFYVELIERGADILSTDRPVEAGRALQAYREQHKIHSKYIE